MTLADLGLDSLMGVEVKQTLERDYDLVLPMKEIRLLTMTKLNGIMAGVASSAGATSATSGAAASATGGAGAAGEQGGVSSSATAASGAANQGDSAASEGSSANDSSLSLSSNNTSMVGNVYTRGGLNSYYLFLPLTHTPSNSYSSNSYSITFHQSIFLPLTHTLSLYHQSISFSY